MNGSFLDIQTEPKGGLENSVVTIWATNRWVLGLTPMNPLAGQLVLIWTAVSIIMASMLYFLLSKGQLPMR